MNSFKPLRVGEAPLIKWSLITLAVFLAMVFLLLPLVSIFQQAFVGGWERYIEHLSQPDSLHAIGLTLMVAALTVPINLVFGVMLAWSVTRFEFPGRKLLITLIDIPFAVSPWLQAYSTYCFTATAAGSVHGCSNTIYKSCLLGQGFYW